MTFICDVMLGKLAKYLRLLGFDTLYARNDADRDRLLREHEDRLFITRRKAAHRRRRVILVRSEVTREQLRELKALLKPDIERTKLMSRCIECNRELVPADKADVEFLVPEFVFHTYADFKICPSCGKVYWQGSHTKGIKNVLKDVFE